MVNARNTRLRRNEGHLSTELRAYLLKTKHSFFNENATADAKYLAIVNSVTEDEISVNEGQIRIPSYKTLINYAHIQILEDTVDSVSMLPLSHETLVNNFLVAHEKSNNL